MSVASVDGAQHAVLFAESDAELVSVTGARLARSLASGASVIVIATPEHTDLFAAFLRDAGVDPDAAWADGTLALLDAAETLAELRPDGAFDAAAFDRVVGDRVRAARAERPVDAFGEMVALLWDEGRVEEAVELERAWDELLRETSASLLCAYPIRLVDDIDTAPQVRAACGLHGEIVSEHPVERRWRFEYDEAAGSRARRAVASALRVRGVAETVFYDVQTVLTELVGSALRRSRAAISVGLAVGPEQVVLRVEDQGPSAARHLPVVDELADRWGIEPATAGKVVWAELAR